MKKLRKMLALLLAMTMVLALGATAFASELPTEEPTEVPAETPEYSITVQNTNSNITINGKTYTAYKLFDAKYNGDAISYTIATDNYFYTTAGAKAVLDKYFTFTATPGDTGNMNVTPKSFYTEAEDGTWYLLKDGTYTETAPTDQTAENYQSTEVKYTKTEFDEVKARELADELQPYLAGAPVAGSAVAANETATIAVETPGYYLVDGKASPAEGPATPEIVAAVALTTARPTATVQPKADAPSVDKKITGVGEEGKKVYEDGKEADASVGDIIYYELGSKVPDMTGFDSYQFIFTDTMSSGLTFNNDVVIKIGSGEEAVTLVKDTDYTVTAVTGEDGKTKITITFINFINQAANKGKDITITYSATLNENAFEDGVEENTVTLKYSHNPYDEHAGTPEEVLGETPEKKTQVYDTNIELTKVDKNGNKLTGAKFSISGNSSKVYIINEEMYEVYTPVEGEAAPEHLYYRLKDGTYTETAPTDATAEQYESTTVQYVKVLHVTKENRTENFVAEGWVNAQGVITFNGLGEGKYTITELIAPEGYNLLTAPIEVDVTFNPATNKFEAKVNGVDATVDNNVIKLNVVNETGTELPTTGGIGTTIFTIVGLVLIIGAGVTLIVRRRMAR